MGAVSRRRKARKPGKATTALRARYLERTFMSTHRMQTRQTTVTVIRTAVLGTAELLEQILSKLDAPELVAARGVCKAWKEAVDTSPFLQQHLFLRPQRRSKIWTLDAESKRLRPYVEGEEIIHGDDWIVRQGICTVAVVNPSLLRRSPACVQGLVPIRDRFATAENLTFVKRPQLLPSSRKGSLLGDMFLTNPPTREVHIQLVCSPYNALRGWYHSDAEKRRIVVRSCKGVRWSDIEDGIRHRLNPRGRECLENGRLKLLLRRSIVWACGVIFYNQKEADAINSGGEDKAVDKAAGC